MKKDDLRYNISLGVAVAIIILSLAATLVLQYMTAERSSAAYHISLLETQEVSE